MCSVQHILLKGVIHTQHNLGHHFKKLHFLMDQTMNRRLTELELTSAQAHVIGYLTHAKESPCARDLESAFGLSHATVSGILSRMEDKGFITIEPDPKDRRVKRICLLERGNACSREILLRIHETERILSEGFSPEELELFRSYLERAIQNLSKTTLTNREE